MKNSFLFFSFFLLLGLVSCSPDTEGNLENEGASLSGVQFEKLSYEETLAKAVKENKLVMIDVYSDG